MPRNSKTANYSVQDATKCLSVLASTQYQLSVLIDEAFDRSIGIQNRNREIDRGARIFLVSGLQCEYLKIRRIILLRRNSQIYLSMHSAINYNRI